MISLCEYSFKSITCIDGNKDETSFKVKGYKKIIDDSIIYYFKNENTYKFKIEKGALAVEVNDSRYTFNVNNKTKAVIKVGEYTMFSDITTHKLVITDSKIELDYSLDFESFKGTYQIILELL